MKSTTSKRTVLVEGNPRQERERAFKMGAALAVVVAGAMFPFSTPADAAAFGLTTLVVAPFVIYFRIRETIRVGDILNGRHFACRSIITLLEKRQQLTDMAERFTHFLETLKNWGGREVVELAPDRPPVARFVEKPHAAHAAE